MELSAIAILVLVTMSIGHIVAATDVTVFRADLGKAYCLHEDEAISGNIIICSSNALLTVNPNTGIILEVAGLENVEGYQENQGVLAKFKTLTDAVQPNDSTTFVVDHANHCLRTIDRSTRQTSPLAGSCQTAGSIDGTFEHAKFTLPYRMILVDGVLYLAEFINQGLRSLDLTTHLVSRLNTDNTLMQPSSIVFSRSTNSLLITINHGIVEFDLDTGYAVLKAGSTGLTGDIDSGPGLRAAFNNPRGLLLFGDKLLIADRNNGKVKQFNITDGTIITIASNIQEVMTISQVYDKIMIGQRLSPSTIFILDNYVIHDTSTTTMSTTTTTTPSDSIHPSTTDSPDQHTEDLQSDTPTRPISWSNRQVGDNTLALGIGAGVAIAIIVAFTVIIIVYLNNHPQTANNNCLVPRVRGESPYQTVA